MLDEKKLDKAYQPCAFKNECHLYRATICNLINVQERCSKFTEYLAERIRKEDNPRL